MEILQTITKTVFESFVPVAKTPERNTSVYDRISRMLETSYANLISTLVSPAFEERLDNDPILNTETLRIVCLDAFVRSIRSNDLVLTATGFGVVSTESTAPASRSRVDALVEELTVEKLRAVDVMLQQLVTVTGWGDTEQARMQIPTLFYRPMFLKMWTTLPLTSANWQLAQGRAATADALLRDEISEEYMDALLTDLRAGRLSNADIIVMRKCCQFMGDFISNFELTGGCPNKSMLRAIVGQLEAYKDSYPVYTSSLLYARRHAKRYENKKEDPTLFIM